MKPLLLLLCALLIPSLPAPAQGAAAPQNAAAPQDINFNFNFQYLQKSRVTAATLGYAVAVPDGKVPGGTVAFDATVTGKNGIIERETLSFIDEKGAILGTLTSTFDEDGHLESQALTEGKAPARPLDWPSPRRRVAGFDGQRFDLDGALCAAKRSSQGARFERAVSHRHPRNQDGL